MAPILLKAGSFLQYNSYFQVLICRKCQYAIQKSAIDSHLRKHNIYRNDRQRLLAEIALLKLVEPEDALQPSSDSAPIEGIPVLQGYRCTNVGCRHLTVSEKRMKRHWSEVHGRGDSIPRLCEFARAVSLQTFFRGTKVKYFEVSSSADKLFLGSTRGYELQNYHRTGSDTTTADRSPSHGPGQLSTQPKSVDPQASIELDLETLKYFYHLITITAHTLPGSSAYWQTKVSSEALQHDGVMYGLLAISACHLAVLATDSLSMYFYIERQAMLSRKFFNKICHDTESMTEEQTSELRIQSREFVDEVVSLLCCAQWAAAETSTDKAVIDRPGLETILNAIRGCSISEPALSLNNMTRASSQANQNCASRMIPDGDSDSARDSTLSVLLLHLRGLPHRMAEVIGKPDNAQDVFVTISAIDALIECCDISLASDELQLVWQAAMVWLTKIPAHFNTMVTGQDPAAMVVLAHWAAILVKRAEEVGCWFLRGASKHIILHIVDRLSANHPEILPLVSSLSGNLSD